MKGLTIIGLTLLLALTLTVMVGCRSDEPAAPRNGAPTTPPPTTPPGTPPTTPPATPPAGVANPLVTEANYDRIENDMTMQQVAEILGPPSSSEPQMPPTGDPNFTGRATWVGQHETVELRFVDGKVTERRRDEHQR